MIHFERIRYKNLLSTGDDWTTVTLDKNPETLIVGSNGAGKSTLLDALCFVLFDKPFRKVSKTRLINSINGKGTLVELNFRIGKTEYMIRRGIKPNKFEVYRDKELLDQHGNARDYQAYLEKNILKLNYKSFTQVVILGSSTFVPFMELSAADRRSIVEDLLDIEIFSRMNILAKGRVSAMKSDKMKLENDVRLAEESYKMKAEHRDALKKEQDEKAADNGAEIVALEKENEELTTKIAPIQEKVDTIREKISVKDSLLEKQRNLTKLVTTADMRKIENEQTASFYADNDVCGHCEQDIDPALKKKKIEEAETIIEEQKTYLKAYEEKNDKIRESLKKIADAERTISTLNSKMSEINSTIQSNIQSINRLKREQEKADNSDRISELEGAIKELKAKRKETNAALKDVETRLENYNLVLDLLKDSGIKTQIIKQYLPVMNKYINDYMEKMNFPVSFELDEEFNEIIRSRYCDEFNYANFSEGEKQRINLSLLLTWRKIAQMRNSAATNLLVLDEVFDSSLDVDGTEGFMSILKSFGDGTNVFVISHKGDVLNERFDHVIEFYKDGNYSRMREKVD